MQDLFHNLYDSHVHFLSVGILASGLKLHEANSLSDLKKIQLQPNYFFADWLYGFGWDENRWQNEKPHKKILDEVFPNFPVFFSRVDGHSSWLNSTALKLLAIDNCESGLLTGKDHFQALKKIPAPNEKQLDYFISSAQDIFLKQGFTHVRDLSTTERLWDGLQLLFNENKLKIAYEGNKTIDSIDELKSAMIEIKKMKATENSQMRILGIKIFYDGSLGSETAYISQPYFSDQTKGFGKKFWKSTDLKIAMKEIWQSGFEISVHCIGDQSIDEVIDVAREVSAEGILGRLNIEHAQLVRPETIKKMKPLHVRCFMQPCHWLSDQKWLKQKLPELYQYSFPWEALRRLNIPIHFGSDAPIENASLKNNFQALIQSAKWGIPELKKPWKQFFEHPDKGFYPCTTEIKEDSIEINRIG